MIDVQWVETCAQAGEFLYGYFPLSILKKLYQTKKGYTISNSDLIETMKLSEAVLIVYEEGKLFDFANFGNGYFRPADVQNTDLAPMMERAVKEGNPYAALHLGKGAGRALLKSQEDVEFYIPTAAEITELVENGYIRTKQMSVLEERIRSAGGDPTILKDIWMLYSTDELDGMEAVQPVLDEIFPQDRNGGKASGLEELDAAVQLVYDFLNHINLRSRRGWQPSELRKKIYPHGMTSRPTIVPGSVQAAKSMQGAMEELKAMGVNVDLGSISSFPTVGAYGERKMVKVGRNDPCPCGSGKKYKRCHGR